MPFSLKTLSAKAGFAAILSFLVCLGIAGLGAYSVNTLVRALNTSAKVSDIRQNQMLADMAHDAIRGEVVAAMYAIATGHPEDLERAQQGVTENTAIFRGKVADNLKLIDNSSLHEVAAKLSEPVEAYAKAAEEISSLAGSDITAAQSRMAAFNADYYALIDTMESVSTAIESHADAERAKAKKAADSALFLSILTIVAAFGLCALNLVGLRIFITRPLKAMVGVLAELARGQADLSHVNLKASGELGDMAKSIKSFADLQIAHSQSERETVEAHARQTQAKAETLDTLCRDFSMAFAGAIHDLSDASAVLSRDSSQLSGQAAEADHQTQACSRATQTVSENVDSVSTAADKLNHAINGITHQMGASIDMARKAYESGKTAESIITELSQAADQISEVVAIINDLAVQTNVLALNATIEAARAGDAGKGFAVVASEVKALAAQTSHSTSSISRRVDEIRQVSERSAETLREIIDAVQHLHEISHTVSGLVDEQSRTTHDMSDVFRRALSEAQTAAEASNHLAGLTASTNAAGQTIERASGQIQNVAHSLKLCGESFINALKAA